MNGWIGVDLDGTLAVQSHDAFDCYVVGKPIPLMIARVRNWLLLGIEVRIFTARVSGHKDDRDVARVVSIIEDWCLKHIGCKLPVTNIKDFGLIELWDDRAITVEHNTGRVKI